MHPQLHHRRPSPPFQFRPSFQVDRSNAAFALQANFTHKAQPDQFEVQFTSRFDAEYRENGRVISIYVESGRHEGQPCIILYPNAFERWDDSPPEMKLPANEQTRISQNFIEAMAFQGLRTILESGD